MTVCVCVLLPPVAALLHHYRYIDSQRKLSDNKNAFSEIFDDVATHAAAQQAAYEADLADITGGHSGAGPTVAKDAEQQQEKLRKPSRYEWVVQHVTSLHVQVRQGRAAAERPPNIIEQPRRHVGWSEFVDLPDWYFRRWYLASAAAAGGCAADVLPRAQNTWVLSRGRRMSVAGHSGGGCGSPGQNCTSVYAPPVSMALTGQKPVDPGRSCSEMRYWELGCAPSYGS